MARKRKDYRLHRTSAPSVRSWQMPMTPAAEAMRPNAVVDLGWGRLILGMTFASNEALAEALLAEETGRRDIALYLRDPHVVLALAPQELFLDPSHTYRLWSHDYRPRSEPIRGFAIRRLRTKADAEEVNRIYASRGMVTCEPAFLRDRKASRLRTYLVAELAADGSIVGTVTGVDHVEAFDDPERGASLWCLAVDPQASAPGVGEALVRQLVEHYFTRGRQYVDLSVMHDNVQAIELYEKLGFQRVPVFCVKRKNPINEPLYVPAQPDEERLNPYAQIIVKEARRRGVAVELLDAEEGFFALSMGGRRVVCRESLTELTSAIAFCRCDDKRLTHRVLEGVGLEVPDQTVAGDDDANRVFLEKWGRIVVKPARGEQGAGISVDVRDEAELAAAVERASHVSKTVVLERMVEGEDLRVIVIGWEMVAAAVRRPATVVGTGRHTLRQLVEKTSRRRAAATGGESRIPIDAETERVIRAAGFEWDSVLDAGEELVVRRTANLHTGGTIHDVPPEIHPDLARVSVEAARALDVPVVGLDLMVPDLKRPDYVIIEANERPGLANHEPQPTAERFVDLLFPQTAAPRVQEGA